MADNPTVAEASATPESPLLTIAARRGCAICKGDAFAVEDVTSNAGAGEGIYFQCLSCGYTARVTIANMGATQDYS